MGNKNYIKGLDNIKKQLDSELRDCTKQIGNNISDEISQKMIDEYQYVLNNFYEEYKPKVYIRHENRGYERGLNKSYRKFKSAPHEIYYGGIEITSNYMYKDYNRDVVLETFLAGYHGRPSLGICSAINPIEHMTRYRSLLISYIDDLINEAVNKVRTSSSYSYIKL